MLLLVWELIVRALAPAYVAKPTGIARVFPTVVATRSSSRPQGRRCRRS